MIITNKTKGERGVRDHLHRLVMLKPNESKEITLSSATLARLLTQSGIFCESKTPDVEDDAEELPKQDEPLNEDEAAEALEAAEIERLRNDLEDLGVKVDKRWGEETLREKLDEALNAVPDTDSE